jgi:CheY-like chemotaxis protein
MFQQLTGPILIVEDDPSDVALLKRALIDANIHGSVSWVSNGDQAFEYLRGHHPFEDRAKHPLPALVLLDIKLPRRSGFEVLEWIRSQPDELSRTVVILLTASRNSDDVKRAYDLRVNSYVIKPDTSAELRHIVQEIKRYWLEINVSPAG